MTFAYIGKALSGDEGLSSDAIKAKRKPQLDAIMRYYRDSKGWTTGPHLFIDERFIWLFTPMYEVGTHAASGNSYHDSAGNLHYSIGIETVGYFKTHGWPEPMQKLLQIAAQSLRDRLRNFEIVYSSAPANRPDLHDHQISFHNDYNKPECPGAAITPQYAIPILGTPYADAPIAYRVLGLPVFQRSDLTGPVALYLPPGAPVVVDAQAPQPGYAPSAGHVVLSDGSTPGFIDMHGVKRI
jgi:hypothetical protein